MVYVSFFREVLGNYSPFWARDTPGNSCMIRDKINGDVLARTSDMLYIDARLYPWHDQKWPAGVVHIINGLSIRDY